MRSNIISFKGMPPQAIIKKNSGRTIPSLKSRISSRTFRLAKEAIEADASNEKRAGKRKSSAWPILDGQNPYADKEECITAVEAKPAHILVVFSHKEGCFIPYEDKEKEKEVDSEEKSDLKSIAKNDECNLANDLKEEVVNVNNKYEEDTGDEEELQTDATESGKECCIERLRRKSKADKRTKKLMNQFNFCERATLTYNNTVKDDETQTNPAIRVNFNAYANQWIIYDAYWEDFETSRGGKRCDRVAKLPIAIKKEFGTSNFCISSNAFSSVALIVERIINQNLFDDIYQDFRYYEDVSDEYRKPRGTLLPLWELKLTSNSERTEHERMIVTDACWNPKYFDLLAVSSLASSYCESEGDGDCGGRLSLWSLKNPSFPERERRVESGVTCLDFHGERAYLLAAGLRDGNVVVYDVRGARVTSLYKEGTRKKHRSGVCQVVWSKNSIRSELAFYSVSSDGGIYGWMLTQNRLSPTMILDLSSEMESVVVAETSQKTTTTFIPDSGTCVAFHPDDPSIFLVGTEEGRIYKCSLSYVSAYLFAYDSAHFMPVNRVDYNKYSSVIFASCSADWRVKIWEDNRSEPLFVFDAGCSVTDVAWAPYSSTVFAAVCGERCEVRVYDLCADRYGPVCEQRVAHPKRKALGRVKFNWKYPILLVGDDKGGISTFKLSPNLRCKGWMKMSKRTRGADANQIEMIKLEKVLSLVREPPPPPSPGDLPKIYRNASSESFSAA